MSPLLTFDEPHPVCTKFANRTSKCKINFFTKPKKKQYARKCKISAEIKILYLKSAEQNCHVKIFWKSISNGFDQA